MADRLLAQVTQICEVLSERELRTLVYLCDGATDTEDGALWDVLKTRLNGCESPERFLRELLLQLKRLDLLKKVFGCGRAEVEKDMKEIPQYRVLMANLNEEITSEELKTLKFLLGNDLPRDRLERAKCFLDVITELEKQDKVSCENVNLIETCLRDIGRKDLVRKVQTMTVPEQSSPGMLQCTPRWPNPIRQLPNCSQPIRPVQLIHNGAAHTPQPLHREQHIPPTVDHYKLNTNPRRVCVIIDCVGHDGELLEQTFKSLHFTVLLHRWLSVSGSMVTLRELLVNPLVTEADVFVCCVISRGTAFHLLATDAHCSGLHMDTLRRMFTPEQCPALAGKPKLFFIQRYSVPEYQSYAQRNFSYCDEELETDGVPGQSLVPTDADVFWSHCWTDERQLQHKHHHSYYLQALREALHRGQRRKSHLVDMHIEVNAAIYEHNRRNPSEPYHIDLKHTLRKNLYMQ